MYFVWGGGFWGEKGWRRKKIVEMVWVMMFFYGWMLSCYVMVMGCDGGL